MKSKHFLPTLLFAIIFFTHGCNSKNQQTTDLQNLGNGMCYDKTSGLMWQSEHSVPLTTFDSAQIYVDKLTLGGHTDWRLPTRRELYDLTSLFDFHRNGECTFTYEGNYWSKKIDGKGTVGSWEVSATQCDYVRQYLRGKLGRVRAVRP